MMELSSRCGWSSRGWNCRVEVDSCPQDDGTVIVRWELTPRMMEQSSSGVKSEVRADPKDAGTVR